MELEGADSLGEIGAARNCTKHVRFEGKFLKQVFDCVDKCCSRDIRDVVLTRIADKIERDGTYQHIVPHLLGNVASGAIHRIHTERSTELPSSKVATAPPR